MTNRSGLLGTESTNAVLGWVMVAVLVAAATVHAVAGHALWAGLALVVVAVVLVSPAVARNPAEMIAWEVLALAAVPIIVRSFGVLVGPASSLAVVAVALVVAAELDAFTSVEMSPEFAVVWVVVVTMAVVGLWTVAAYASDVYLGTALLGNRTELMWDIVVATGVGLVAGLVFEFYVRRISPGHDLVRQGRGEAP